MITTFGLRGGGPAHCAAASQQAAASARVVSFSVGTSTISIVSSSLTCAAAARLDQCGYAPHQARPPARRPLPDGRAGHRSAAGGQLRIRDPRREVSVARARDPRDRGLSESALQSAGLHTNLGAMDDSVFDLEQALAVLARTPATLDTWLRDLPQAWTSCNEGPDTFSAFDVVGHLI